MRGNPAFSDPQVTLVASPRNHFAPKARNPPEGVYREAV
jgi:hypothetical protein